nr:immunoglobulin light chain junction region [Macaca mulatta]
DYYCAIGHASGDCIF